MINALLIYCEVILILVKPLSTAFIISSPSIFQIRRSNIELDVDAHRYKTIFSVNSKKEDYIGNEEEKEIFFDAPEKSITVPLSILLIAQLILYIGVGAVLPSIPLVGKELGISSAVNGIVISAPAFAMLIGGKFSGNFADFGRKKAMIYGMAVIAMSDVGTALSTSIVPLVLARLGLGTGRCVSEAGERGMLVDLANKVPEKRGRVLGAQQTVIALGIGIGAPIGGAVIEEFGARAPFLCVSVAAIITLLMYIFLPETISSTNEKNNKDEILLKGDWAKLLSLNSWKGLALCQCGATFGFAAKLVSIPIIATKILPGGATAAGFLISAAGLSGLAGAPIGGWLTDRFGANVTVLFGGIVSAFGLILIPFTLLSNNIININFPFLGQIDVASQTLTFSASVMTWSLGASTQSPALVAIAQKLAPLGAESTAMALPPACRDATYIIAPILLGLVADSFSSIQGVECAVAGTLSLLGAISLTLLGNETGTFSEEFQS